MIFRVNQIVIKLRLNSYHIVGQKKATTHNPKKQSGLFFPNIFEFWSHTFKFSSDQLYRFIRNMRNPQTKAAFQIVSLKSF